VSYVLLVSECAFSLFVSSGNNSHICSPAHCQPGGNSVSTAPAWYIDSAAVALFFCAGRFRAPPHP
jgi:hypothetical protein